jgi:long-chain fatty acid transport protein
MRHRGLTVLTVVGVLGLTTARPAGATDGHFLHGVGAVNSAMGGAGVAAPRSLLGTFYLNPAGLLAFDGTRVEFGFELFRADRTVASSVTGGPGGSTESKRDWVPIPAMAWTTRLANDRVVVGLAGLGVGGFGVDYPADPTNPVLAPRPFGFGQVYSNYQLLKIVPAVAIAATERLWLGAAVNVDWASLSVDPAPIAAPAVDPGPDGTPGTLDDRAFYSRATAADGAFGFGFQAGFLFKPNDLIAIGASYTSEQAFEDFEFNGVYENPNLPTYGTPRTMTFKLNVPAVVAGGVALSPLPNFTLAADYRYILYEGTEGFDVPGTGPFNPDGSVSGFAWKNISVVALGGEYRVSDRVALRAGYNYSENPVPDEWAMINVPAPAIVQNHVTGGIGYMVSSRLQVSAAYYRALANDGSGPLLGPTGPVGTVTNSLSEDALLVQFSFATRGGM